MQQVIITILSALSPLAVVLYLVIKEARSGSSQLAVKIQSEYRERNAQLERQNTLLVEEKNERSVYITKIEVMIQEKDKQLDRYEKIFANRNPDLTDILKEIREYMKTIHEQNNYQTRILETRQDRDKEIDEASLHHIGAPMRAPVKEKTYDK